MENSSRSSDIDTFSDDVDDHDIPSRNEGREGKSLPWSVSSRRATVSGAAALSILRGEREYYHHHETSDCNNKDRSVSVSGPPYHHRDHGHGPSRSRQSLVGPLYRSVHHDQDISKKPNAYYRQRGFTSTSSLLTDSKSRRVSSMSISSSHAPLTPAPVSIYKDSSYWLKTVVALAIAKSFVEAGLRSAYANEVSAFGGSAIFRGFLMLAIEVCVSWFCPRIHRWFELRSGVKYLLSLGAFGAGVHVYYLVLGSAIVSFAFAGYMFASVIAALLYPLEVVTGYIIVGRSAYFCCRDPTRSDAPEEILTRDNFHRKLSKHVSWFFGIYFFSLFGAGIVNMLFQTVYLHTNIDDGNAASYLMLAFWSSGLFTLSGIFLYLAIPPCPRTDVIPGTPAPHTSPIETMLFPLRSMKYRVFTPLLLISGMVEGFLYGDFILYLVDPILGPRVGNLIAGFLQALTGGSSLLFSLVLYKTSWCRKRDVVLLGTSFLIIGLATFAVTTSLLDERAPSGSFLKPNYAPESSAPGGAWQLVEDPSVVDYVVVLALLGIMAAGFSVYLSQLPVIVNAMYQETSYHTMANANIKALSCMGYAVQLALSLWVYPLKTDQSPNPSARVISPVVVIGSILLAYSPLCLSCMWPVLYKIRRRGNHGAQRPS